MAENSENVINFTLSKDIYLPLTIGLHALSGLTSSLLLAYVRNQNTSTWRDKGESWSTTDVLVKNKLLKELCNKTLLCELHVESGNGKKLTIPIVKGLSVPLINQEKVTYDLDNENLVFSCSNAQGEKEWVHFPVSYNQLPLNSTIVARLFCMKTATVEKVFIGEGRVNLFDDTFSIRMGKYRMPIVILQENSIDSPKEQSSSDCAAQRLAGLEINDQRPIWLSTFTNKKLQDVKKDPVAPPASNANTILLIEFPKFDSPVIYSDVKYAVMTLPLLDIKVNHVSAFDPSFNEISYQNLRFDTYPTVAPFDPDMIRIEHTEDPIEQKFRRLERIQTFSPLDKESKPTAKIRAILNKIMAKQFFEKVSAKERNIVWKYRWYLLNKLVVGNKAGWNNFTVNFIKCVDWNNESEVNDFEAILKSLSDVASTKAPWTKNKYKAITGWWVFEQELEVIDSLELLTGNYRHKTIRAMAINRLAQANDEELSMFMVQLVQNIKYDITQPGDNVSTTSVSRLSEGEQSINEEVMDGSDIEDNQARSISSSTFTNGSSEFQLVDREVSKSDTLLISAMDELLAKKKTISQFKAPLIHSPLVDFLIKRAIDNTSLSYSLYWCLKVEADEESERSNIFNAGKNIPEDGRDISKESVYQNTMKKFVFSLAQSEHGTQKVYDLRRQIELAKKLHDFCLTIKFDYKKESTPKKVEILRHLICDKQKKTIFSGMPDSVGDDHRYETMLNFPAITMPLDPSIVVSGSFPEECTVFKSSLSPIKISFKTIQGLEYPVMYKIGDDLRQDQFITQLISLMEKILENENMDLQLRPYKILATGPAEGFIQFIPNSSLSSILSRYNNSILSFLKASNPDENSPLKVKPEVMDNYVRSCAGYCVVTYILGIGDRHLENLLLSPDGHFFHADFGYILGQDPKPFPPLMKLPIQIIEGMGGLGDDNYKSFCQLCFITYITLRKNASLILNLVQLMINTSIPALFTNIESSEQEKQELLWKVEEKFMLDMSDEEAVLHFQTLIDDSVSAVLPVVIDRLHSMAQYWRA